MSSRWVGPLAMAVAMGVDRRWGEPPVWAHPVVAMGRYLGSVGPMLTKWPAAAALLGGVVGWLLGACAVGAAAHGLAHGLPLVLNGGSTLVSDVVLGVVLGLLLKPLLAWRMLRDEVAAIECALTRSVDEGRTSLQRLVSRDVQQLDETAVRESAIESLAENLNDSVVAPLFWFAVGGLGAAAVYRFANTADAMWGYRGRYEWAGKWAAKADDVLSWLPARLTALLLCLAAGRWPGWTPLRAQARITPSPNGGWPMGAMALLLGVRLSKPGVYVLNERGRLVDASDSAVALRWSGRAAWLASLAASCWMAASP